MSGVGEHLTGRRCAVIIPARNEEASLPAVIREVRAVDARLEIVVVDDDSSDATAEVATSSGATVLALPFHLGIGGAVQTGYRYALTHGHELAVQIDGDGQHDPRELAALLAPVLEGRADLVVGSRFVSDGGYRTSRPRRVGIRIFARMVSALAGVAVTDPTSGFRAANRRAIALFAADYAHDYPEVEAIVTASRRGLAICEVPVHMRERAAGRSSITTVRAFYYMTKVLLTLAVAVLPRRPEPG